MLSKASSSLRSLPFKFYGTTASSSVQTAVKDASSSYEYALSYPYFPGTPSVTESFDVVQEEALLNKTVNETTLENGLKVISTDSVAKGSSVVSLFVNAGTRNENFNNSGVSHFVQKFFYSATNQRSYLRLVTELQKTGASVSASHGREDIVYRAEGIRSSMPQVLELMSNSITQTRMHDYDLGARKDQVQRDVLQMTQSPELLVYEAVHQAAFDGKTLGNALLCPPHNLNRISTKTVVQFMNEHVLPEKMTLVGTNINHSDLVDMASDFFGSMSNTSTTATANVASKYVGGQLHMAEVKKHNFNGPNSAAAETLTCIAFQGVSQTNKDMYVYQVLSELLGQGSNLYTPNFGGRSTRLYQNVVAPLSDLHSAAMTAKAFSLHYSDNGLFGVLLSSSDSTRMSHMVNKTLEEIRKLAEMTNEKQVQGAKNRVLMQVLGNIENGANWNEFVRNGNVLDKTISSIQSITIQDIKRVVQDGILKSKPTLVNYGNLNGTLTINDLQL